MNDSVFSNFLVPHYIENDADGFSYSVKYPDYLEFTGNLSIASPSTDEENPYTDSLIIWPLLKGGYEYGVILYTDDTQYQIYIDKNGNAIDEEDENIVAEHSQSILTLLEKANTMWGIE
jgi:DNA modification methylase